jgi:hypothetical protein
VLYNGPYRKRVKKERICRKSEVKRLSEAKNKMSIIERIRFRIGELVLYGGKTVCDSPQNGLTTNNKASSLRATSEDKGSANSHKEIFELFAALTHKKNRIGRSLIVQSCAERAMTIKAKIITATDNKESSYGLTIGSRLNQLAEITRSSRVMTGYIMNITFNGGYHA